MTAAEVLDDYVETESDDLVLKVLEQVKNDGFSRALDDEENGVEMVALKVLSQAMIKCLALMTEKMNHPSLAMAYMQIVPMHTNVVKNMMVRDLKRQL